MLICRINVLIDFLVDIYKYFTIFFIKSSFLEYNAHFHDVNGNLIKVGKILVLTSVKYQLDQSQDIVTGNAHVPS